MKTNNISKTFAALSASLFICAVACDEPAPVEPVTPVFPELVENYEVAPGDTLTLTFTPNMDWEVSVPEGNLQWFWIDDMSYRVSSLEGTASKTPVNIMILSSGTEEFDKNRSCEVTLTMGEESKVIAKFMRPATQRTMSVYYARHSGGTDYECNEDGSYVYESQETTQISLLWSDDKADFRAPILVEANCQWQVEHPDWIELNVPETTIGRVEVILSGESITDKTGDIIFKSGEEVLKKIAVSIPSCREISVYNAVEMEGEWEYDEEGYVYEKSKNLKLVWMEYCLLPIKVVSKCNWTVEYPDWMTCSLPDKTAGEVLLTLQGVPSKYPLDDTRGNITFKKDGFTICELRVTIPGCRDYYSNKLSGSLTSLEFNSDAYLKTSVGFSEGAKGSGILKSPEGTRCLVIETSGGIVGQKNPDWLEFSIDSWNTAEGASKLQEREWSVTVTKNLDLEKDRSAIVFFLPASISKEPADLFDNGVKVIDEYVKYSVSVNQMSRNFRLEVAEDDVLAEAGVSWTSVTDATEIENLTGRFGETNFVYTLEYDDIYGREKAALTTSLKVAKCKVFDENMIEQEDAFWLEYVKDSDYIGKIDMYYSSDPAEVELPKYVPSVGYVVMYDEYDTVLAIIKCVSPVEPLPYVIPEDAVLDDNKDYVLDASNYFVEKTKAQNAGFEMYEVVGGNLFDANTDNIDHDVKILKLLIPAPDNSVKIYLDPVSDKKAGYCFVPTIDHLCDYISIDGKYFEQSLDGIYNTPIDRAAISMKSLPELSVGVSPLVSFYLTSGNEYPFVIIYLMFKN